MNHPRFRRATPPAASLRPVWQLVSSPDHGFAACLPVVTPAVLGVSVQPPGTHPPSLPRPPLGSDQGRVGPHLGQSRWGSEAAWAAGRAATGPSAINHGSRATGRGQ